MAETLFGFKTDQQWHYENGFYLTSHVSRCAKLLAQYEIYKSIIHLPGHVVECGVYKGASLMRLSTFREILENAYSRKIIGFDAFGTFPRPQDADDQAFIDRFELDGGDGISVEGLQDVFAHKGFENYELVSGDICDTVPDYVQRHPELKIALLHIDVDVYQPSLVVMRHLYDRVVTGGVVALDDYGIVAGETRAIDEFFAGRGGLIEKSPMSHRPAFIRKA